MPCSHQIHTEDSCAHASGNKQRAVLSLGHDLGVYLLNGLIEVPESV